MSIAETLQGLMEELEARLRGLVEDERRLEAEYEEVRAARLRQEGAVDCLRLVAKRLAEAPVVAASDAKAT